jgi:hypothetical protein
MSGDGSESRIPVRLFWVGFILRVLYMTLAHTYRVKGFLDHFQFGWEMGRVARSLATGRGYANPFNGRSGVTAWVPPAYPLLMAGVFKLFGVYTAASAWVILAVNSVFSAAIAPVVYETAWRSFGREGEGRKIALWSGWLWALHPAAMQYAVRWLWEMSLTALLFSWVIVLALRVRGIGEPAPAHSQTARRWVCFGLLWGLIALSNSSLLAFLPACGLWMLWDAHKSGQLAAGLRNATLAGVCFLAVICPWVVRNWYALHAFVPMRSNFGAELYMATLPSNNALPWGTALPLSEADPVFQRYEHMGELAFSKQQGERARAAIRADRKLYVDFTLRRIYFFWVSVPHTDTSELNELLRTLDYAFISFSGLLGLALALRRGIPGAWLYLWAMLIVPLIYYFVTVQARFRHPLEPVICILSVYLFRSADRTRVWSWQRAASLER